MLLSEMVIAGEVTGQLRRTSPGLPPAVGAGQDSVGGKGGVEGLPDLGYWAVIAPGAILAVLLEPT